MDRVISASLKNESGFSEAEIEAFLSTFEQNKAAYTETNADTVDTLFSFIDFEHFKKSLIDMKKAATSDNTEAINEAGFTNKSENDKLAAEAGGSDQAANIASYYKIINEPTGWKVKLE
jgi:hypothetical protein